MVGCEPANRANRANLSSQPDAREASRSSPPYGTFRRKDPFSPRQRGFCATVASSPLRSSRQSLVRGVQSQHGAKSTIAIGICCTPKNGLTWQLSAVVRISSKASETSSDHPQRPAIVRTNPIDLAFVLICRWLNPRVADEAVYVVNASRVRVRGMEGIDITCLICHSGWGRASSSTDS